MKRWLPLLLLAAAAALPTAAANAQWVHRNQGGTINWAPYPAVYEVAEVDDYGSVVWLRGQAGETEVHVPEWVFDLCQLSPGDLVRVDFFVREPGDPPLRAASIWPVAVSGDNHCKLAHPPEAQASAPPAVVPSRAAPSTQAVPGRPEAGKLF